MPPSDKELDKLAKEAAESFEAPGAVPDWDRLRAALDADLPGEKDRRVRPLLWFTLLLLLGGAGYLFTNSSTDKMKDLTDKKAKAADGQIAGTPGSTNLQKPAPGQLPASDPTSVSGTNHKTATNPPLDVSRSNTPVKNDLTTGKGAGSNSGKKVAGKNRGSLKNGSTAGTTGENGLSANDGKKSAPAKISNAELSDPSTDLVQQEAVPVKVNPAELNNPGAPVAEKPAGVAAPTLAATSADSTPANVKKKSPENTRHAPYEITFAYAPELTTIGFSDLDKPGSSYGILLGYHLSNKFMVQTGFIKSRKNYTADGEDYKLHYQVPPPYKLDEVVGFCDMYELPLNVKYQLTSSKKINTSFTAGVSSYFMTQESYVYKYTSSYNSYNRDVNSNSQKNYWFSLATVAVGFEKDISKSLKAGASPYIKIPFTGMGTGDLKLTSTGINFSLTYRPTFTR